MSKSHKDGQWQPQAATHLSGLYAQFKFSDCVKTMFFNRCAMGIRNQEYDLAQKHVTNWAGTSKPSVSDIHKWTYKQCFREKKNPDEVLWHVVWLLLWIRHNTTLTSICQNWEAPLSLGLYTNCFSLFKMTFWKDWKKKKQKKNCRCA